MKKDKEITNLFKKIAEIPSPSGFEKDMADFVYKYMKKIGLKTWKDKTGGLNNSNSGNVYAYLEVNKKYDTLVFSAHLDTVQKPGDFVKIKFKDGVFKSDGTTILGADNKSGVTSLLSLAKYVDRIKLKNNLLFFFPTREEAGKMGSSYLKPGKINVRYIFNIDSTDKPGVFVYKSLGYLNFSITVKGLAAHAAKDYEKGKDAILGAAKVINRIPVGRNLKEGWTLNLGSISGGGSTNVVSDYVTIKGELRAFKVSTIKKLVARLKKIVKLVSRESRCKIDFIVEEQSFIPPFLGSDKGDLVRVCSQACVKTGIDFTLKKSFSTSDANSFSGLGYKVISVSRGGKNAHSVSEELSLSDLRKTHKLLLGLCGVV